MRAWKYASASGGLEKNLILHASEALPKPGPNQHLIKVLAVGLNPVDFKPAEAPFVGRFAVKKPATPGFDVAGRIVTPADSSSLEPGQLVFGAASTNPLAGGGLAEYVAAPAKTLVPVPTGVSPLVVAGAPIAAVTAHGSIVPYVHAGSRVFINGGSGGVGTYGIQIAKAVGAHVTVSCSTKNVDLCRSLGADEVLDYTKRPLLEQLKGVASQVRPFDHVVDNVFSDPALYFQAHTYTSADAKFVEVASGPTLGFLRFALAALLWPAWLGGGRRKFVLGYADIKSEHLEQIGRWIADGEIKPVTDQVFAMEDAVEAFKRLKTGRARGKVIVNLDRVEK
jgi:NADPH:quinone reductase-like Zn-dependent oxidoreductase